MAGPFLACLKVICDYVESLRTLGSFLGAEFLGAEAPLAAEVAEAK